MTIMLRAFMPLWLAAVCLVAVGVQAVTAAPASPAAIAASAVNCEKPTDLVSASNSGAALLAQMEAWWKQKQALSEMEAWWRERTAQRAATASVTALPSMSEAIAQMEAWSRERGGLRNAARKPAVAAQHRRHKGYSNSPTEFIEPNDSGISGPIRSMLRDDELSAIGVIPQR